MSVDSIANTGLQGMVVSQQQMTQAASEIAQPSTVSSAEPAATSNRSAVEPLTALKAEELVFDASAKVVSTADETVGALLDIKA